MGHPLAINGKAMWKTLEIQGERLGNAWDIYGIKRKLMEKPWETLGKSIGYPLEFHVTSTGNTLELLRNSMWNP